MVSKALENAINDQISSELYSSNLYLSMAAYCELINLRGFAKFFRTQSDEEREHALKLYDYMITRNAKVKIKAIEMPPSTFSSLANLCQQFYDHEREVTAMINNIYDLAQNENDYPTHVILHWFINEQVEEENTALTILEQVKMAGKDSAAILILDQRVVGEIAEGGGEEA